VGTNDFYRQLRERVAGYAGPYAEQVLLVPDLFVLVSRLMLDNRVAPRHKAYLGAALAYVISPIDLLPERIVGLPGYLDDVVVLVASLNALLNEGDQQVVLEHWSGTGDLLAQIQGILKQADQYVGKAALEKLLASLGIGKTAPGATA
jgi:uncharacterized membrane protein YkvA (DUF1232 family)